VLGRAVRRTRSRRSSHGSVFGAYGRKATKKAGGGGRALGRAAIRRRSAQPSRYSTSPEDEPDDSEDISVLEEELKTMRMLRWRRPGVEDSITKRIEEIKAQNRDAQPAWRKLQHAAWVLKKAEKAVDVAAANVDALVTAKGNARAALEQADANLAEGQSTFASARRQLEDVRSKAIKAPSAEGQGMHTLRSLLGEFKEDLTATVAADPRKKQALAAMEASFAILAGDVAVAAPQWAQPVTAGSQPGSAFVSAPPPPMATVAVQAASGPLFAAPAVEDKSQSKLGFVRRLPAQCSAPQRQPAPDTDAGSDGQAAASPAATTPVARSAFVGRGRSTEHRSTAGVDLSGGIRRDRSRSDPPMGL